MKHFDIDQLYDRRDELAHEAQAGELALITSDAGPLCVAVPFDDLLLKHGVNLDLATKLFAAEVISLGKAASLAGMSLPDYMAHLHGIGIPIARPLTGETERELAQFG
jgi:predicted HTH domain antitoxin